MHYIVSSMISALAWGIIPLIDRYSSRYLNGLTLASTRGLTFGLCALFVFIALLIKKKNNLEEGYKRRGNLLIFLVIISPIIGFLIGHLGYYYSITTARSSIVQIVLITHVLPLVFLTVLAPIIYKDKINWQMILGIILAIVGLAITVIYNPNHKITRPFISNLSASSHTHSTVYTSK